jgi:hypothetical protein
VTAFAIRAPSIDDLLDPYSSEPLERRPLRDEVRERILRAWIDTREERPSHLSVELPAAQRGERLATRLEQAIRTDFAQTEAAYLGPRDPSRNSDKRAQHPPTRRRYCMFGISLGGIIVIVGIVVAIVWSLWLGVIIALIGLIAFGGFARGKWY